MKLVRVDFDAEEAPSVFTVSLTLDELALLYRRRSPEPHERCAYSHCVCWIPPNAPTRGFYASCWQLEELYG